MTRFAKCQIVILAVLAYVFVSESHAQKEEDPNRVSIPLDVTINGRPSGETIVSATRSLEFVELDGARIKDLLAGIAIPEQIEALPDTYTPIDDLVNLGLEVSLNLEQLRIEIVIQQQALAENLKQHRINLFHENETHADRYRPMARVSAFTNFQLRASQQGKVDESLPWRYLVNMDHSLNIGGWAIDAESFYSNADSSAGPSWVLDRVKVVKDLPGSLRRVSIGELSTPVSEFQRGFQIFGLSVEKEFSIQPYGIFTPTGTAEFEISESATVNIDVNGSQKKVLQLDPGFYNIEDFRLAAGQNSMNLEIIGESGERNTIDISTYSDPTLIRQGQSQYAFAIGWPIASASQLNTTRVFSAPWYDRYVSNTPIGTGFFRRGLSEQLTAEVSLQTSPDWARLAAKATWATPAGLFTGAISGNQTVSSPFGLGATFGYRHTIGGYTFNTTSTYTGLSFNSSEKGQRILSNSLKQSSSFSIQKILDNGISLSLNAFHQRQYEGSENWSAGASIGKRFKHFHGSLRLRSEKRLNTIGTGGYVTINWSPKKNWRTRFRMGQGDGTLDAGTSADITYRGRNKRGFFRGNLNVNSEDDTDSYSGSLNFTSDNYRASLSHSLVYDNVLDQVSSTEETSFEANAALAFADGALGITRRITDSFAIIANHKKWKGVEIGIDPSFGGYRHKSKGGLFKPVLGELRSYRETRTNIRCLDDIMFLEESDYYFNPSYHRGYKLTIGDGNIYMLKSALRYANGELVTYKAIRLVKKDGSTVQTFTNRTGRFLASGLSEGEYTISVVGDNESARAEIKGQDLMIFVKEIQLQP